MQLVWLDVGRDEIGDTKVGFGGDFHIFVHIL